MDIFSTTLTSIQETYRITVFIRGVVLDVRTYEGSTQDIQAKLDHEFLFLEQFKTLMFDRDDAAISYASLPDIHKKDIQSILAALSRTLGQYGLFAMKHGFNISETQATVDSVSDAVRVEDVQTQSSGWRARFQQLRAKVTKLDWALFDKDKVLKLLDEYSEWTERLRQVMFMILLVAGSIGQAPRTELAERSIGDNLRLSQVAKRQLRAETVHEVEPLDENSLRHTGTVISGSLYQLGEYEDPSGFGSTQVLFEKHLLNPDLRGELSDEEGDRAVTEPVRLLASLLRGTTSTSDEIDSGPMRTLECLGYIADPRATHALLVYKYPATVSSKQIILSLHEYIEMAVANTSTKPSIGERFAIAHSLATSLFGVHVSGWVHKGLCSKGVLLFPIVDRFTVVPHLIGWGTSREAGSTARLRSRKLNEDLSPADLESNVYRHPERYGKPSKEYTQAHDIYALGVVLLEIGCWKTMSSRFSKPIAKAQESGRLPPAAVMNHHLLETSRSQELKQQMGAEFSRAVERCLKTDFDVEADDEKHTVLMSKFKQLVMDKIKLGLPL